ncbi:hypothetical protein B0P06_003773 [Clostridium saccharoperbutylacetonicum]|uniref:Uncharacterized protein n=1 Tax=Clostridium saccharoperbutylacetonicum N1-4(HMT) TaxID=931276 RepID=M1N389_9CLOT|nr:hypothetical protein [Clostridium saccharoperbutylacetonicum]AGF57917.1 hypothetical protein Cspa_c41640 [Clostridium saccharoperbutylacetonicum N1-4(HMT)]NRT61310.1 hypothetical protein [Clostridium saccharoperbutylacetonicum]NSB24627.1 hypothetical protein [Clostridium saccharoperbutylacetonicum]NSB44002.1 hypothetical protein [Clostridium saccharoperbutylacetonicum]
MEIGQTNKFGDHIYNYESNNIETNDGAFSFQLDSANKSEVLSDLQKKFIQANFEIADVSKNDQTVSIYGDDYSERFNVIISPIILKQMEESMSRRIEIENKIFRYIHENNTGLFNYEKMSSGIIFHSDGTVEYWSIPEYSANNENQKNKYQDNNVYGSSNYRGESELIRKISDSESLKSKAMPYDGLVPLYNLGVPISGEAKKIIYNKSNEEDGKQSLLEYLKEKFCGINIHIIEIKTSDEAILKYGEKCDWRSNVCISPVIFKEMETDSSKEAEIEERISDYLNDQIEEIKLNKIIEVKTMISGIIFHKDQTWTHWSKIIRETNINKQQEFIFRQMTKEGKYSIRRL